MRRNNTHAIALIIAIISCAVPGHSKSKWPDAHGRYQVGIELLEAQLSSAILRKEARQQISLLEQGDAPAAMEAIFFFSDLRARHILLTALSDSRQDFDVRAVAAATLARSVEPGDRDVINTALAELIATDTPSGGGSEIQIPRQMYRYALVELLEKETSLSLIPEQVRRAHLAATRTSASEWTGWNAGLPEGQGSSVEAGVEQWLEQHKRHDEPSK